jgi:hypothetical protein
VPLSNSKTSSHCLALESELFEIYNWLDARIAEMGLCCDACGQCCHFDRYGHQLWLTSLELEVLLRDAPASNGPGCPWLCGHSCEARGQRALGCRTFFCKDREQHVTALHEEALDRLRKSAARAGIDLEYEELGASLERLADQGKGS